MDIAISTAVPDDTRILFALGNHLNLKDVDGVTPRPATTLEFKDWLIFLIDQMVIETEGATVSAVAKAAIPPLLPIT